MWRGSVVAKSQKKQEARQVGGNLLVLRIPTLNRAISIFLVIFVGGM